MATDFIGSSGTLVGAALETVGYYYQSLLIDGLGTNGFLSIATLVYLLAAIIALSSFVVTSRANMITWFVMGPLLFYASVFPRQETAGANWVFGDEQRDKDELSNQIDELLTKDGVNVGSYTPRVPVLFAQYNNLVSTTVQETVRVLKGSQEKMDLKIALRPHLAGLLNSSLVSDRGLRELIQKSLLDDCAEAATAGRSFADQLQYSERRDAAEKRYREIADRRNIRPTTDAAEYLVVLYALYPELFNGSMNFTNNIDTEVQNAKSDDCHKFPEKCSGGTQKIQDFLALSKQREEEFRQKLESAFGSDKMGRTPEEAKAAADAVLGKLSTDEVEKIKNGVYTCREIWSLTYAALHLEARRALQAAYGPVNGIYTEDEFRDEVLPMLVSTEQSGADQQTKEKVILQEIAKRILSNEASTGSAPAIVAGYVKDGDRVNRIGVEGEAGLSETERARLGNREWTERTRLMVAAFNLPYYQGLILYFLAVTYPFFAFLLLMPGKHSGFILWFMMWLWAKSWDIGYAVVGLLDNILYSIFVVRNNADPGPMGHQLGQDFSVAMLGLREADPSFQPATYYNIVGVLMHSIPVLTSYLILGGLKGGAGLISAGIARTASYGSQGFGGGGGSGTAARRLETTDDMYNLRTGYEASIFNRLESYVADGTGRMSQTAGAAAGLIGDPVSHNGIGDFSSRNGQSFYFNRDGQKPTIQDFAERAKSASYWEGLADGYQIDPLSGLVDFALKGAQGNYRQAMTEAGNSGSLMPTGELSARNARLGRAAALTGAAIDASDSVAKAAEGLTSQYTDSLMAMRNASLGSIATWAEVDSFLTTGRAYASEAMLADMIGVVWGPSNDAFVNTWKEERTYLTAEKDIVLTALSAAGNLAGDITNQLPAARADITRAGSPLRNELEFDNYLGRKK